MSDLFIEDYRIEGRAKFMKYFKGFASYKGFGTAALKCMQSRA
jgi:hypothetical protein